MVGYCSEKSHFRVTLAINSCQFPQTNPNNLLICHSKYLPNC